MDFGFSDDFFEGESSSKKKTSKTKKVEYTPKQLTNKQSGLKNTMEYFDEKELYYPRFILIHENLWKIFQMGRQKRFFFHGEHGDWFEEVLFEEPMTLDNCAVVKNQADLLFYQRKYEQAMAKYKERLKYMINKNNNAVLREIHTCIIHCCLKLNLFEEAEYHVVELMKTVGNPSDSSIPILGFRVYKETGKLDEAATYLYQAIQMNPWYTEYWLEFFALFKQMYDKKATEYQLNGVTFHLNDLFFQLILQHIMFIAEENIISRENEYNRKSKQFKEKIEDIKLTQNIIGEIVELYEDMRHYNYDWKNPRFTSRSGNKVIDAESANAYWKILFLYSLDQDYLAMLRKSKENRK